MSHLALPETQFPTPACLHTSKTPKVWRQSCIAACETCPRRAIFEYRCGLKPIGRSSGRDRGSYAHLYVNARATGCSHEEALQICMTKLGDVLQVISYNPFANGNPANLPSAIADEREQDMQIGVATGSYMWSILQKRFENGSLTLIGSEAAVSGTIECSKSCKPKFRGQIDLIVEDHNRGVWLLDMKTTGENEDVAEWCGQIPRRIQPHIYYLLARQSIERGDFGDALPPGTDLRGMLFAVIAKPTIRRKQKSKGQSMEDYLDEIREWYAGTGRHADKLEDRQMNPPVVIYPYAMRCASMPDWLGRRIRDNLKWLKIKRPMLSAIPPHELSCKFGGSLCGYRHLCNDPTGRNWPELIEKHYTTLRDPLDSVIQTTDQR